MSFETLYMVNGVTVNENLRGQAYDLYIEDAIQETNVATAGISAEYGRFGGGVVNVITKSGGNLFSGSFRDTLNNDNWRTLTPFETDAASPHDPAAQGATRIDKTVPTYEYTARRPDHEGPSLVLHRRPASRPRRAARSSSPPTFRTPTPTRRGASKARAPARSTRTTRSRERTRRSSTNQINDTFNTVGLDGRAQPLQPRDAAGSVHR